MNATTHKLAAALATCAAIVRTQNGNRHDDTNKAQAAAREALAEYEAGRCIARQCHDFGDTLRPILDAMQPAASARFGLDQLIKALHWVGDDADTHPEDYGDRPQIGAERTAGQLQDARYSLLTDSQEVRATVDALTLAELGALALAELGALDLAELGALDLVADDASGAIVCAHDGEMVEIWLTDSARPFDVSATYTRAR